MNLHLLKGRVTDGRLVIDAPVQLPEGTQVDVAIVDPGDNLDAVERAHLDNMLAQSWAQARAGQTRPANELLDRLRRKR
ncbi:MAG: hypothetical protein IPM54_11035 [Polyangiaceae bacterium]|nr:hypothetical protein [Polyangiaceae bacterium]